MGLLSLNKSQSVRDVEVALGRLHEDASVDLQVPVKLKNDCIGGEAALVQLIITWARRSEKARLVSHVQEIENSDAQLERIVDTAFGFVAALMAKEVVSLDSSTNISRSIYALASDRVDKMSLGPEKAVRGHRTLMACVDHSSKWRIPPFYYLDGKVKGRSEFKRLAESLVATNPVSRKWFSQIPRSIFESLGTILHELFRNTHDWARSDISGVRIPRSVRGILVEIRSLEKSVFRSSAEGAPALEEYIDQPKFLNNQGRFRCVEISVFDSGPGIAARWLRKGYESIPSIGEEYEACLECLQKHRSSSLKSHAGIGLNEVVRTLSPLSGFVRFRSGRLSMYRDFVRSPIGEVDTKHNIRLFDWNSGSKQPGEMPSVDGTLVTMVIPLISADS